MSRLNEWWQHLWLVTIVQQNHEGEPIEENPIEEEPIVVAMNGFPIVENDVQDDPVDVPAEIEEEAIQPLRRSIRIIRKPRKYYSFYTDRDLKDMGL